jgi:catechol 2,3-dioxygenase-like lactoylglutathione lyase family enzyme
VAQRQLTAFAAVFTVTDVARALAFYTERLGFGVEFKMGDPPEYAIVDREAVSLHLMPATRGPDALGTSSIYVFTADVDALYRELLAHDCPIEVAPEDFDYGMREMSVRDADGNRMTFGQAIKMSSS